MPTPHLTIERAHLAFNNHIIFSDFNLTIHQADWIGILGPSGIGKTSLLRLIAGLKNPHEKSSVILTASNRIPITQQIAYMTQTDLLLPWLTVLENATLCTKLRYYTNSTASIITDKATSLLKEVGLEHAMHLYPTQLSGGMRQRVALVRTIIEDKPIVLLDEPFQNLDAITRYQLQTLIAHLLRNKTVLFITHDPTEALRLAHTIYIMQGHPATLKCVANLSSAPPRELNHPDIMMLQASLFNELSLAAGKTI